MKVVNLNKTTANTKILQNITFGLEKGKVTAIIGPNGAGKSTLLSIMSRLLQKDSGSVMVKDKEINLWKTEELAKELSILKQQNNFQVKMTVRELMSFGRFPYSKGRLTQQDYAMIETVLAYLEMEAFADRYLDTLSGGQLQRAAIGMILVQDTEYILLDEPLNNLDLKQSVITMQTIRKMAEELGKTIVIVLHDVNFAAAYADSIIALKDGQICYSGSADEVICSPVLADVYGIEMEVQTIRGKKCCLYCPINEMGRRS